MGLLEQVIRLKRRLFSDPAEIPRAIDDEHHAENDEQAVSKPV